MRINLGQRLYLMLGAWEMGAPETFRGLQRFPLARDDMWVGGGFEVWFGPVLLGWTPLPEEPS